MSDFERNPTPRQIYDYCINAMTAKCQTRFGEVTATMGRAPVPERDWANVPSGIEENQLFHLELRTTAGQNVHYFYVTNHQLSNVYVYNSDPSFIPPAFYPLLRVVAKLANLPNQ